MPRRAISLAILVTWMAAPALAGLARPAAEGHESCTGHVCRCRDRCPPKRPAAKSCHEEAGHADQAAMSGRCHHEPDPIRPPSRVEGLPIPRQDLRVTLHWLRLPRACAARLEPGHTRIDPRPPGAASPPTRS